MGFSEGISAAFNRVRTDVRDLFLGISKSDKNGYHPSRNIPSENLKTKAKPITRKHTSNHPLFNNSKTTTSPSNCPLLKQTSSSILLWIHLLKNAKVTLYQITNNSHQRMNIK